MYMALPKPPEGWDINEITKFFDAAKINEFATFANLKGDVQRLTDIDTLYRTVIDGLNHSHDWFAGFFVLRAHSNYLASCRLSWSGQIPECYALLRSCLENALYGLYLARNPDSRETWLRRHDSNKHKQKVRDEFKIGAILTLAQEINEQEGSVARTLYNRTIDYGAHPNELALMQTLHIKKGEKQVQFKVAYLEGNSDQLALALAFVLKTTAQIGVCSLSLLRNIYKERYDILGVTDALENIKKGL